MLKKGTETKDPKKTKQAQLVLNLATILTGIACTYLKKEYPDIPIWEFQDYITGAFVTVFGFINIGLTAASTKKIGVTG